MLSAAVVFVLAALAVFALRRIVQPRWQEAELCVHENAPAKLRRAAECLKGRWTPTWWLTNGHISTLYTLTPFSHTGPSKLVYSRHIVDLPDGGSAALDFYPPLSSDEELEDGRPVAMVLHGVAGCSKDRYVVDLCLEIEKLNASIRDEGRKWRVACMIMRGCGGLQVNSGDFVPGPGHTDDVHHVISHLRVLAPTSKIYALGFSLGGNILSRYLSCYPTTAESGVEAGVVIGAPWDFEHLDRNFTSTLMGRVYSMGVAWKVAQVFGGALPVDSDTAVDVAVPAGPGVAEEIMALEEAELARKLDERHQQQHEQEWEDAGSETDASLSGDDQFERDSAFESEMSEASSSAGDTDVDTDTDIDDEWELRGRSARRGSFDSLASFDNDMREHEDDDEELDVLTPRMRPINSPPIHTPIALLSSTEFLPTPRVRPAAATSTVTGDRSSELELEFEDEIEFLPPPMCESPDLFSRGAASSSQEQEQDEKAATVSSNGWRMARQEVDMVALRAAQKAAWGGLISLRTLDMLVTSRICPSHDTDEQSSLPLSASKNDEKDADAQARAYYRRISAVHSLHRIQVPLLGISALDDPICVSSALTLALAAVDKNPNLALGTLKTGGHLGFFQGGSFWRGREARPARWVTGRLIKVLQVLDAAEA